MATTLKNENFEPTLGDIKSGDWFKSKWRLENKFFHYVLVKKVLNNGYICADTNTIYPFDDVLHKAKLIQSGGAV